MSKLYIFLTCFIITLILTIVILIKLIPFLKSKKVGQKILEIGPRWHKIKEGTPTMGGISFIIASFVAIVVCVIVFYDYFDIKELILLINIFSYAILNALIGLIDDIAKMKKSKNEGLTPKIKFLFQSIVAILFLISLSTTYSINTTLYIPFFDITMELGLFYYVIAYLLLCGIVNSVNLTDGLDGLAAAITLTVGLFISFISFTVFDSLSATLLGATLLGASIGFLAFNLYPARIFMGDTGSLFFGAIVVSVSFVLNNPLLVLIYGFIFVIEALSDILQVGYFKLSHGKRIFKMAPLHHHFEKSGFSEMQIVAIFTLVNMVFCIFAYFGLGNL